MTSSTERLRRAQLARAKRELAEARVEEAQTQLDLVAGSQTGSVERLTDVRSEGGNSARARPRSSADLAAPLIQLEESEERVPETGTLPTLQESNEEHLSPKGESALTPQEFLSPKGERTYNPSHTFVLQQNICNSQLLAGNPSCCRKRREHRRRATPRSHVQHGFYDERKPSTRDGAIGNRSQQGLVRADQITRLRHSATPTIGDSQRGTHALIHVR